MVRQSSKVGLYPSSTSNHNKTQRPHYHVIVGLYPSSTSNHNPSVVLIEKNGLGYILLLHQTTTPKLRLSLSMSWVISFFYIKPQPPGWLAASTPSWVISFFYIKPQLNERRPRSTYCWVISFFYIKPQLFSPLEVVHLCWVISFFYIKPQLLP